MQLDPEELESETGHAKIQLASLKPGGFFVKSMGRTYVEGLFDGFSSTFDKDLADLRYMGHELVAAAPTPERADLLSGSSLGARQKQGGWRCQHGASGQTLLHMGSS